MCRPQIPPKIFIQNKSTTKNTDPTTLINKANSHQKHISQHIHKSIIVSLPTSGHPTLEQSIFSWLLIFQQKMLLQFLLMYSFIQNKISISLISLLSFIFDRTLTMSQARSCCYWLWLILLWRLNFTVFTNFKLVFIQSCPPIHYLWNSVLILYSSPSSLDLGVVR